MKLFEKLGKLKKTEDFNFGMSDIVHTTDEKSDVNEDIKNEISLIKINGSESSDSDNEAPTSKKDDMKNTPKQQPYSPPVYGIQETINLIRSLPESSPEVMIPVVIKTLESANIDVNDIIADAAEREEMIEIRSVELVNRIEALEAKIAELNDEAVAINNELEDVTEVKNMLLGSILQDNESAEEKVIKQKAAKPETPEEKEKPAPAVKKTKNKSNDEKVSDKDAKFGDIDIDQALEEVNNIHIVQEA